MEFVWLMLGIVAVVSVGGALMTAGKAGSFARLGEIPGKSIEDITNVVGQPTSVSAAAEGGQLLQWMGVNGGSGYHYAILFGADGKAVGYTHQHVG